jgi:hypothetical protein
MATDRQAGRASERWHLSDHDAAGSKVASASGYGVRRVVKVLPQTKRRDDVKLLDHVGRLLEQVASGEVGGRATMPLTEGIASKRIPDAIEAREQDDFGRVAAQKSDVAAKSS